MSDEMVERIAKLFDPDAFDPLPGHEQGRCENCDGSREEARRKARAALEALREPSEEMIEAMCWPQIWAEHPAWQDAKDGWQAAIDSVLGRKGGE